jgi:DNA-binding NtrC family response regulator
MREKILVIQTDPKPLEDQAKSFYRKYNVVIANNNSEAMEICRTGRHNAIVFIMDGPDECELSLLREIKSLVGLDRPIIAITHHNSLEIERAIAEIGVFYHLLGPFQEKDLDELIAAAVQSWNKKSPAPKSLADRDQEVEK